MIYYEKNDYYYELTKEVKALRFAVETAVTVEEIERIILCSVGGHQQVLVRHRRHHPRMGQQAGGFRRC